MRLFFVSILCVSILRLKIVVLVSIPEAHIKIQLYYEKQSCIMNKRFLQRTTFNDLLDGTLLRTLLCYSIIL